MLNKGLLVPGLQIASSPCCPPERMIEISAGAKLSLLFQKRGCGALFQGPTGASRACCYRLAL